MITKYTMDRLMFYFTGLHHCPLRLVTFAASQREDWRSDLCKVNQAQPSALLFHLLLSAVAISVFKEIKRKKQQEEKS